ncbi:hypothetical protein MRX96_021494 [Rhipicephalus microplus]
MLSAENFPAPGDVREAALDPGAVVPPGDVPARTSEATNRIVFFPTRVSSTICDELTEHLRKENAQLKQDMSRLDAEMAEIRKLAPSPPSAQPAPASVAMDTSEAIYKSSGTKRRAAENAQEEEAVKLLSELKDSFVNMQATLAKIQEAVAHPKIELGALSEHISKLEEVDVRRDPSPTPLQVPAQHNVLTPLTEGAILRAAIAAQPSSQPKHR